MPVPPQIERDGNDSARGTVFGSPVALRTYYDALFAAYGPQHWWPGRTAFEIIVGAILTQNTSWSNVETAIRNLRREKLLTPRAIEDVFFARSTAVRSRECSVHPRRLCVKNFFPSTGLARKRRTPSCSTRASTLCSW